MSAIPQLRLVGCDADPVSESAPVGPSHWISLDEAARRSGLNEGSIRRRCLEQWHGEHLARKIELSSGRFGWEVSTSAHPNFAEKKLPEPESSVDLLTLTDAQRITIARRRSIVEGYLAAASSSVQLGMTTRDAVSAYLRQLATRNIDVGRSTLLGWVSSYRQDGDRGLLDRRSKKEKPSEFADFLAAAADKYLDQRKKSARLCHDLAEAMAEQMNWPVPAYKTTLRHLNSLPVELVQLKRFGNKSYTDRIEPHITRDFSTLATNDWWNADHHQFDVMILAGHDSAGKPQFARPVLHAWQDMRSRYIVGWSITLDSPNSDLILRVVRQAIKEHGAPKNVYMDNGKDFDAKALQGVTKRQRRKGVTLSIPEIQRIGGAFNLLGISVTHCWPYHGQSKPIERFFGTVCSRFAKLWDTYCGNKPTERPEDLQKHLDAGKAPTLAEFTESFREWLVHDYHGRVHLGDSMNEMPETAFTANLVSKRAIADALLEFATFRRVGPVKVDQVGVRYQGLCYGAGMEALIRRIDKKVMLAIDERDARKVLVLDLDGKLICNAPANIKLPQGADAQLIRDHVASKRRTRKIVREANEVRPRLAEDIQTSLYRAAAKRKAAAIAGQPQPEPPSISPVRTPFDGQHEHIERALDESPMRIAVGAESFSKNFQYPTRDLSEES